MNHRFYVPNINHHYIKVILWWIALLFNLGSLTWFIQENQAIEGFIAYVTVALLIIFRVTDDEWAKADLYIKIMRCKYGTD